MIKFKDIIDLIDTDTSLTIEVHKKSTGYDTTYSYDLKNQRSLINPALINARVIKVGTYKGNLNIRVEISEPEE